MINKTVCIQGVKGIFKLRYHTRTDELSARCWIISAPHKG